jgi:hypothetical protein
MLSLRAFSSTTKGVHRNAQQLYYGLSLYKAIFGYALV